MRLPGWLLMVDKASARVSDDGSHVVIDFRVRYWHPGLWLEILRARWRR